MTTDKFKQKIHPVIPLFSNGGLIELSKFLEVYSKEMTGDYSFQRNDEGSIQKN